MTLHPLARRCSPVRLIAAALVLAGCTTRPVFTMTGNPADSLAWRTETRRIWSFVGVPVGAEPVDVFFQTQGACEAFRTAHPEYTKASEVCEAVYGTWSTRRAFRRLY